MSDFSYSLATLASMSTQYIKLKELARSTRLPAAWLRREADEGRLPCIKAGRIRMFDPEAVKAALSIRQQSEVCREE